MANLCTTLRKHTYSNLLNISPPKTESFQMKIQIFLMYTPVNPSDTGSKLYRYVFVMKTSGIP